MTFLERIRPAYVIIPSIAFIVMIIGKIITSAGMTWYKTLVLPSITPPGWVFSVAWQIIYTCTTVAAILVWDALQNERDSKKKLWGYITLALFGLNAALNITWTVLFFKMNNTWASFLEAFALNASVLALIFITWCQDRRATILLIPYFLWVSFAIYLNYQIWTLNKATFYLFRWLF